MQIARLTTRGWVGRFEFGRFEFGPLADALQQLQGLRHMISAGVEVSSCRVCVCSM